MPIFHYQGRNSQGQQVHGEVDAANQRMAFDQLKDRDVIITQLEEGEEKKSKTTLAIKWRKDKVTLDELILFTRQLYALTKAGVPIIRTLRGLADSANNPLLQKTLNEVCESLIGGTDLASALKQHPTLFSPIYISMVHVGESTGRLDDALHKMIDHLELERETIKRIKSALRYPIMVVSAIAIAITVITLFVIPQFSAIFDKLGADLPLPTIILMETSTFMQKFWWLIALILVGGFFAFKNHIKTPKGELWWDKTKIGLPLFGAVFKRIALSRFSRTFAMMISAGVPLVQSLGIVAEAVGNRFIGNHIRTMNNGIERGERIASTAQATGMFTPLVLQMIAVGEETGSVDSLLNEVADFYEQEVDYELKRMSDAIEPILIVFLGGVVLVLALGVFLPMWSLGSAAMG